MVTIRSVDTVILDIPTIRPHVLAMATMNTQAVVLTRILCSDDIEGVGEGTTIGGLSYGEESPESIKLTIDRYMTPLLMTCDATRPAEAMRRIGQSVVGNHFAKSAIETALLDAQGRRLGVPVSELLGARLCDRLPVLWTLASGNTEHDIAEAEDMIARRRHNIFKIKIGRRDLGTDITHVTAIKRALGARASVRVDINQAWDEATAKAGIEMLADAGVDLVEQPIARTNRAGLARLSARSRIPIMADEALRGPEDAFDLASRSCATVFAVKIAQSGGPSSAKTVAAIGDAAGIALYGGTMLEGAVGTIASAHLFSTFPALSFGTELFGPLLLTEEILIQPLDYADFSLGVPNAPGLGLTLDEDAIGRLRRPEA